LVVLVVFDIVTKGFGAGITGLVVAVVAGQVVHAVTQRRRGPE
jgi:hypothetical protein